MQAWSKTLLRAEDSLRELEDSVCRVRAAWPVTGISANGPAREGSPGAESLRQLASEVNDLVRRCEELPKDAIAIVESAWEHLEANELPDWDDVGRTVLKLLTRQAEDIDQVSRLVRRGEESGLPPQEDRKLNGEWSRLLDLAQDFRDSWPWPTGNKPDDPEDAAAAQRAMGALPSFEALSRLAEQLPPPQEGAREIFNRLARQWKEERGPSSSARRLAAYPSYRAIVAMGKAAIPFLLAELERQPDHWFIALHELTGADPVPKEARGRLNDMVAAWVKWGKENGFVS